MKQSVDTKHYTLSSVLTKSNSPNLINNILHADLISTGSVGV